MEVSSTVELNDSDILSLEKGPLALLKQYQGKSTDLESFRRMAVDSFGEAGFQVTVKPYTTNQANLFAFDIEITGRVPGSRSFDPDRQVHEVVNNLLELPGEEKGFIKTDHATVAALRDGDVRSREQHRH